MPRGLLIVDVQNDFTEGGALGVDGGAAIAARIRDFVADHRADYDLVVASRDWHDGDDDNGGHFAVGHEPDFVDTWPVHCVAGTPGADFHPAVPVDALDAEVRKGQGVPAYSAFQGTVAGEGGALAGLLTRHRITDLDVVGIATDYCVRASALDAIDAGQRVRVLTDLVAGVAPASSAAALEELAAAGAELVPGRLTGGAS